MSALPAPWSASTPYRGVDQPGKRFQHASHLFSLRWETRQLITEEAINILRGVPFDSIAFSGVSGALVAPMVASALGKELILVRKKQDTDNHSGLRVEGFLDAQRYVFLDDLIGSGSTFRRVIEEVHGFAPKATCIGIYQYIGKQFADNPYEWPFSLIGGFNAAFGDATPFDMPIRP